MFILLYRQVWPLCFSADFRFYMSTPAGVLLLRQYFPDSREPGGEVAHHLRISATETSPAPTHPLLPLTKAITLLLMHS
jgi:hypothetical protein